MIFTKENRLVRCDEKEQQDSRYQPQTREVNVPSAAQAAPVAATSLFAAPRSAVEQQYKGR